PTGAKHGGYLPPPHGDTRRRRSNRNPDALSALAVDLRARTESKPRQPWPQAARDFAPARSPRPPAPATRAPAFHEPDSAVPRDEPAPAPAFWPESPAGQKSPFCPHLSADARPCAGYRRDGHPELPELLQLDMDEA